MNIKKIVLYGFGRHENVEINLQAGMNLLYGPNEAGKTTIQQAILHILFGFPQKNQQELRYEPKTGGKYGGCLYIEDAEFGDWMIERVRGKSSGDVTIRFEDGRTAGEEELKVLLRGYDRQAFEAVFSFSLFQLQGLEKMDEDDLSRTLLASGTTGLDSLWKVEKRLEKEASDLFKKSGRVPPMNQKIAEIKELEQAMQKEQQKLAAFEPLTERQQELKKQVKALREEEQQLHKQADEQVLAMQVVPLQQQERQLTEQLSALPDVQFPAEGIRRYEELASRQAELEIKKQRLLKERQQWQADLVELRPDNERQLLERWTAQEAEWHRMRTDTLSAEQEIRLLETKKLQLKHRLALTDIQLEAIGDLDISIQRERQLEPLIEQQKDAEQQIKALNRMLAEAENEREEAEQRKQRLEQQAVTQEEMKKLEKWPEIKRRLAEAKVMLSVADQQSTSRMVPLFLLVIGLMIGAYSMWQQQWLFVIVGVVSVAAGFWLWKKQPASLEEQLEFIRANEPLAAEMESLTERFEVQKREQQLIFTEIEKMERKLTNLVSEMEQLHQQKQQAANELEKAVQDDPIDLTFNIQESFRLLRELQDTSAEQQTWRQRLQAGKQQLQERIDEVEELLGPVPESAMYERLRQELMNQKELLGKYHSREQTLDKLQSEIQETEALLQSIEAEIQTLFDLTKVSEKEQFYTAYQDDQQAQLLKRQLREVHSQLSLYGDEPLNADWTLPELERSREATAERLTALREEVTELVDEQVKVDHELTELGKSGALSELQQLFEMRKAELADLAQQWTVRKAVTEAIRQTMSEWKEHQLPAVLKLANEWFSRLTGGRYRTLGLTVEGYFQAVTYDGQSFMMNELSQATKEQAYLSLRLALASALSDRAPFPIIMDDPFVHFDNERLSSMIEIIKALEPSHQFLYFTCHSDREAKWSSDVHKVEIGKKVKGEID
ncbi:AAA family ATPase [Sporosarcina sp.]|uniref:ATP-binding protein n=1 Tax=Sporosarcina sp. TaxID=49982 RepID=UPI002609B795|nr:AAA family ATPase [Sporosarcina sp.]